MNCGTGDCAYQTFGEAYCYFHAKKMLGLFSSTPNGRPSVGPEQVLDNEQFEIANVLVAMGATPDLVRRAFQKRAPRRVRLTVRVS